MTVFQQFAPVLRSLGFRLDYTYARGGVHGNGMRSYIKRVGNRCLDVQIWENGGHRVTHGIVTHPCDVADPSSRGYRTTFPTDFKTIDEMKTAIQHETDRTH